MRYLTALIPLLFVVACSDASVAKPESQPEPEMLPARLLRCTLGHALNLDETKFQTIEEIKYEGAHRFTLFLPSVPKHEGPPPDPSADPEPVHPATRIVEDPSGLTRDIRGSFGRVVDLWPQRVELVSPLDPPFSHLIIVSDIDTAKGVANLFMTRAADAGSLDLKTVYQGGCRIEAVPSPR